MHKIHYVLLSLLLLLVYMLLQVESFEIIYTLRLPRLFLVCFIGAALSVVGLIMQTIFQNPLASPYTLGIGAASAFGASLGLLINLGSQVSILSAFLFAALVAGIMLKFATRYGPTVILLIGVLASFFFSSLIVFLQYLGDYSEVFQISRWLMGSVSLIDNSAIALIGLISIGGVAISYVRANKLDLLLLGDDLAITKGLNVTQERTVLLGIASLLVAVIVAYCGPIAFIGIIVPNTVRMFFGARHKTLILACAWAGAALMVLSDLIAKNLIYPYEIPVGIITAVFGAPWFLVLFLNNRFRLK